jgi:hypothetical protein
MVDVFVPGVTSPWHGWRRDGTFRNPWPGEELQRLPGLLKWWWDRTFRGVPPDPRPGRIRALLERHDLVIQEWDWVHADWVTIRETERVGSPAR